MWCRWWLFALVLVVDLSWAADVIIGLGTVDSAKLRKQQGVERFVPSPRALRAMRIVVIDRSFPDFVEGSGQLPNTAKLYAGPLQLPEKFYESMSESDRTYFRQGRRPEDASFHGTDNTKIHHAMMGAFPEGAEYALVVGGDAKGIRRAAKFADWWDANVVICAQNIPGFGNRDGLGEEYDEIAAYLNRDPRRFWVNSAGNYERLTHTANVKLDSENRVVFRNGKPYLRIKMRVDGEILVTAVWDSFSKSGTDKNIDLYVLGEDGRTIYSYEKRSQNARFEVKSEVLYAMSETVQHIVGPKKVVPAPPEPALGVEKPAGEILPPAPLPATPKVETEKSATPEVVEEEEAIPPVEEIAVPLKKNSEGKFYYIELVAKGGRLSIKDEVRVIVRPKSIEAGFVPDDMRKALAPPVELVDWTTGQNVYYPADYKGPGMIVVGEISNTSSRGLTANGAPKPDVFLPVGDVMLSNGRSQTGTSLNTFLFAGHLGLLKAVYPEMTRTEFGRYTKILDYAPVSVRAKAITDLWKDSKEWDEQHLPYLQQRFPGIFDVLKGASQTDIQSVGIDPNGMYQFGYRVSPATFRSMFGEVSADSDTQYEYYLASWQEQSTDEYGNVSSTPYYQGYTRKRRTDSTGEEESYPWLRDEAKAKNPAQYVEIRRMRSAVERQAIHEEMDQLIGRVYRVPTETEVKAYFGK